MQQPEQKHICHLTVLNPARHSRIFYKEARSQVDAGYQVSIIGQDLASAPYMENGIRIVPAGIFSRLSRKRLAARKAVIDLAAKQKADLYQIHAPELLAPARKLLKMVPGCKLVYDMHEDYALNIREGGYYPDWIKNRLAAWVRKKEQEFASYGHGLIEAEECFRGIVDFPPDRTALVRNKYLPPSHIEKAPGFGDPKLPLLVYTGTIAENWGAIRSLELWSELQKSHPVRLAMVGHTHDLRLLERIRQMVHKSGFADRFLLVGGEKYVPYEVMTGWIAVADAGLALYRLTPNIKERIPTKFYEFMAAGNPVIHTQNPSWDSVIQPTSLSFPMQWPPASADIVRMGEFIAEQKNRPSKVSSPEKAWSWNSEKNAMLELLAAVFALSGK